MGKLLLVGATAKRRKAGIVTDCRPWGLVARYDCWCSVPFGWQDVGSTLVEGDEANSDSLSAAMATVGIDRVRCSWQGATRPCLRVRRSDHLANRCVSVGLSPWANRLGVLMQGVLACVGWVLGIALCALALGDAGSVAFFPLALLLPLWLVAVVVHEGGHYAAARAAGMVVLYVRIGRIEVAAQRHGWRIRWAPARMVRAAGYVVAVHDPARPLREQSVRMTWGGPGANLLVAVVLGPMAFLWLPHAAAWLMLAFAVLNAVMGVANLIPSSRGIGSDGLHLLQWRDRQRALAPGAAHAHLLALTVSGVTAEQLPADLLDALDVQPAPMPLVALWYRLKASQHRGEWQAAAEQQTVFERLHGELPPALRSGLAEFIACIRTELAFSSAMRDGDAGVVTDGLLSRATSWSAPTLRPRCLALRALLDGDPAEGQRLLDEVQCAARQSVDRALLVSEMLIQRQMLALMAANPVSPACAVA